MGKKRFFSFSPHNSKDNTNPGRHLNPRHSTLGKFTPGLLSSTLSNSNEFSPSITKMFRAHGMNDYSSFTSFYLQGDLPNPTSEAIQEDLERMLLVDSPYSKLDSKFSEEKFPEQGQKAISGHVLPEEKIQLRVQSAEEQELLSSTPAHPLALKVLYMSFFITCFVENLWRFAWPVAIARIHPSFFPIAVASFFIQFFVFIGGPPVGELIDTMPRVKSMDILSVFQAVSMLISASMAMHALGLGDSLLGSDPRTILLKPWFIVLVLASSIEKLTGLVTGVAIERDWVVHLVGVNREIALAKANSMLRRVELLAESAGPLFVGFLIHKCGILLCFKIICALVVLSLPTYVYLIHFLDHHSKGALKKRVNSNSEGGIDKLTSKSKKSDAAMAVDKDPTGGLGSIVRGWKFYLRQAVLPASVAYVLLSFNAVLSPGSLMMSFLTTQGLNVSIIGMFGGACSGLGYVATFISAPLIASLGVLHAGALALLFHAFTLILAVLVYLNSPTGHTFTLTIFLSLVALSSLGQWTYDMVDAQIFQTGICESQANVIGMTELSLSSLAELCMLGVAIWMHDVKHFGTLASVSMAAVLGATYIYCHWVANPNADQKRLFPNHQKSLPFPFKFLFPSVSSIKQWRFQN